MDEIEYTKIVNGEVVPMTPEEIEEIKKPQITVTYPPFISMVQFRLGLLQDGVLNTVETSMADPNMPEANKIAWEYSTIVSRDSRLVDAISDIAHISSDRMDTIFRNAAQLDFK